MSASKVEALCHSGHLYRCLEKVTCRKMTSLKASDTADLPCRAEIDLSLSTSGWEAALCEGGCLYLGESHLGTVRGAQERSRRGHREAQGPTCSLRLTPSVR